VSTASETEGENGRKKVIGGIITLLVILALIAIIWGRETAQGCVSWLIGIALVLLVFAVLAALGVSHEVIGTVLLWSLGASVIVVVGLFISLRMDDARHQARLERRRRQRAIRERKAARQKQQIDSTAQTALEEVRQQRMSTPQRLRAALDAGHPHVAYNICSQCAQDWAIVANEWRDDGSGDLISWSQLSPPPQDGSIDEARLVRYAPAERDAMLDGVIAALEEAVSATGDGVAGDDEGVHKGVEERATCALLALSGFSEAVGNADSIVRRVTRLLHRVICAPTSSQARRVTALVALGAFASETTVLGATSQTNPTEEPLSEYLRDDDPEVRAAAVYAIGQRLLLWFNLAPYDEPSHPPRTPDDIQQAMATHHRAQEEWGQQYGRTAVGLLGPLLTGDPDATVRAAAAQALIQVDIPAVRATLRKKALDLEEDEAVRLAASTLPGGSSHAAPPALTNELTYLNQFTRRSKTRISPIEEETVDGDK
jgi:hypothetical protein